MSFETSIALRYLAASRRRAHVALITTISILGLAGCTLSLLVGLRLLRAIGKSGHLDQKVSK